MTTEQPETEKGKVLNKTFRALRHRNYQLFFIGQGISLIGTWMQQIAMVWLVYRLTGSVFLLGAVGFAGQIPSFIFAPVAGALVDRWNRHRTIIITQTLSMLQAMLLAFLVLTGIHEVWHIILMSIFLGLVNAFDMPARQAFVIEMVEEREDLSNAIALNSSLINGARLIGPSIAGILIAAVGEGMCFLINGLSFIAVIIALMAMKITPKEMYNKGGNVLQFLREGFSYAFGFAPIKYILLLLGLTSLMGMPYQILMPVFAKDIFHGGADTLGFIMAASGVGALVGGLYLLTRKSVAGLVKVIPVAAGIFGIGLVAFSLSNTLALSLILMVVIGFGMMVQTVSSNTALQHIADDDKRGRVMAFFMMAFIGMTPIGSLLVGAIADVIGAQIALIICGASCVLGALIFAAKLPTLRKIEPHLNAKASFRKKPSTGRSRHG